MRWRKTSSVGVRFHPGSGDKSNELRDKLLAMEGVLRNGLQTLQKDLDRVHPEIYQYLSR